MTYQVAATAVTLNDLELEGHPQVAVLSNAIRRILCSILHDFNHFN